MAYTPTSWQNSPSTSTPINASNLNKMETGIDQAHDHIADASDAHDASAISVVASGFNGNLDTTDDTVQKVAQKLDDLVIGSGSDASVHIADNSNAHAATAINHGVSGGAFVSPGTVEGAIFDLDYGAAAALSAANNHIAAATDAHDASAISVSASGFNGNLATTDTNMQLVAQKLDDLATGGGGAPSGAAGGSLAGTYPNPTLATDSVGSSQISANAVGSSELADNAVDTAAIADSAVTFAKIAGAAIGTSGSTVAAGNHTHSAVYSGSIAFGVDDAVTTRTGKQKWYNDSGRTRTIVSVRASVDTAPTGATLIVDVNKGGTTIFGTQSARPTVAISGTTNKTTGMTVTTWEDGTYLTCDVDQVGSTVAGSDLSVVVEWS